MEALSTTQNETLAVIKRNFGCYHLEPLFEVLLCLEIRVLDQYCSLQCWFEKKFKISILLQTALSYVSNGDQVIFIRPHQFKAVPFPVEGVICLSTALLDCIKMMLVSTKKFDDDNRRNFGDDRRDFDNDRRRDFDGERNFGDDRRKKDARMNINENHRKRDFRLVSTKKFDDNRRNFGDDRRRDFDGERSFGDDRRRDFDGERSFGDDRRRDFDGERSFSDDRRSDFDGERSFSDDRRSDFDGERSFSDDRRSDFDGERSFSDDRRSDFDGERSFSDDRRRDFDGERSFGDDRRRDFDGEKSFGDDRRRDFDGEKSFSDDRRRDFDGERSFSDDRRKDFDGERSFSDDRRKDFDGERSFSDDRRKKDVRMNINDNRRNFGDDRRKDFDGERSFGDDRRKKDVRMNINDNRRNFGDDRRRDFDGERSFGDDRRKKDVRMNINENHRKSNFRNILIEKALENENFSRALILVKQALRLYNSDIMDDSISRKLFVLKQNTLSFYVASKISSAMWKTLELECPASDLVAYPPPDHYILENLRDFVTVLTTSADTLTSKSPLWNEMKVLQNIQAKYNRILRCDHFLIFLQRVGHCLRKMVLLNLSKSYLDLAERFLVGFQDLSGTPQLPSRQQVEYVLIRTLSASKLVCEAINYSRESFCYIIQKLKVGHLILDLIMATSIIARLNILLQATLEQLSSMYKQVLFWRYKVKKGGFQWAEKFDFPQDIEEWVKSSEPAYLKPLDMSKEDMDRIKSMLKQSNVITNKTKESDNESVVLVSDEDSPANETTIIETDFGGASKLASDDWQ